MPGIDTLNKPAVIKNGRPVMCSSHELAGREKTIAYRIL